MFQYYFLFVIILSVAVPFLFEKYLDKMLRDTFLHKSILMIFVGILILFVGISVPLFMVFSAIDYPKLTKSINHRYYFIQQEYGFATMSHAGKDLYFYQIRPYWFDKDIGQIHLKNHLGEINAKIISTSESSNNRLILTTNNKICLDTILSFEKEFEFMY
jgi:hypothetical protein